MRHLRALVAGLLTVSLAFAPRPAAAQPRTLTPADLFDLEYVAEPAISPDGEWIVYVRRWSVRANDRRYVNIWILRSVGTGNGPLTSGRSFESAPV
ncbi:MAG: S9 family peptidase, partial [Gemmatimonas sp.]